LQTLIISSHELIGLDVSECNSLIELNCQSNQIDNLNVSNCSNLKRINCSNNSHIKELDFSTCIKLEEVHIDGCSKELVENKNAIKSDFLIFNIKKNKLVKGPIITSARENDIRNILIVG